MIEIMREVDSKKAELAAFEAHAQAVKRQMATLEGTYRDMTAELEKLEVGQLLDLRERLTKS